MATTVDEKKVSNTRKSQDTPMLSSLVERNKLDFGDLEPTWGKMIKRQRPGAVSNLFRVNVRINKLDPLAEIALEKVKQKFSTDEEALRKIITQHGLASELDRVIKRINNLRISENKRVILAEVYPALLNSLLACNDVEEEVKDEIGFTDAVLFELERENGPLDYFSQEVVKLVGAKHRIRFTDDNVLCDLVAHQVRIGL